MKVKKFNRVQDYERIIDFLTEQYKINKNNLLCNKVLMQYRQYREFMLQFYC